MHAIVTGAGGFLGRYVARALSNSGWRVTGIGHGHFAHQEQAEWGIASWYSSDISVNAMTEVMRHEGEPQLIFHSAGSASVGRSWDAPLQDFERTVVTLAAVIESLRRHAPMALLIYPSSAACMGTVTQMPSAKTAPSCLCRPTGRTNSWLNGSSHAHRLYGVRTSIIRFFSLYGVGLRKQLLWDITQRLLTNPRILRLDGDGLEMRDFLYAEDAARLVVHIARQPAEEPVIVNGGNGRGISVGEVARRLIKATGNGGITEIQFSGIRRKGDPMNLVADVDRLRRMGFRSEIAFDSGIGELVRWGQSIGDRKVA